MNMTVVCTMKVIKHFSIASISVIKEQQMGIHLQELKQKEFYNSLHTHINKAK